MKTCIIDYHTEKLLTTDIAQNDTKFSPNLNVTDLPTLVIWKQRNGSRLHNPRSVRSAGIFRSCGGITA